MPFSWSRVVDKSADGLWVSDQNFETWSFSVERPDNHFSVSGLISISKSDGFPLYSETGYQHTNSWSSHPETGEWFSSEDTTVELRLTGRFIDGIHIRSYYQRKKPRPVDGQMGFFDTELRTASWNSGRVPSEGALSRISESFSESYSDGGSSLQGYRTHAYYGMLNGFRYFLDEMLRYVDPEGQFEDESLFESFVENFGVSQKRVSYVSTFADASGSYTDADSDTELDEDGFPGHSWLRNQLQDLESVPIYTMLDWGFYHEVKEPSPELISGVISSTLSNIHQSKADVGVFLAEGRESAELIKANLVRAKLFAEALKRKDLKLLRSVFRGSRTVRKHNSSEGGLKSLNSLFLEFQYGWRPLIHDLFNMTSAYLAGTSYPKVVRVTGAYGPDWLLGSRTFRRRGPKGRKGPVYVKEPLISSEMKALAAADWPGIKFYPEPDQPAVAKFFRHRTWDTEACGWSRSYFVIRDKMGYTLERLGLANPASIAWELVPYSFVVDWFADFGAAIENLTALNSVEYQHGTITVMTSVPLPFTSESGWGPDPQGSWQSIQDELRRGDRNSLTVRSLMVGVPDSLKITERYILEESLLKDADFRKVNASIGPLNYERIAALAALAAQRFKLLK